MHVPHSTLQFVRVITIKQQLITRTFSVKKLLKFLSFPKERRFRERRAKGGHTILGYDGQAVKRLIVLLK